MFPPPGFVHLRRATSALRAGGVIACPTEAVWGLGCDPFDPDAVARLLHLKHRPVAKGLILVASDVSQVDFLLAGLSGEARATLAESWPGPTTWLLPHHGSVPSWISGQHATVAVRVSSHPALAALCDAYGGPLVSTSANPGGARPARAIFQVYNYFGSALDYVLPGRLGARMRPTVIRDLASGAILRA